jgi:hypothetical protein
MNTPPPPPEPRWVADLDRRLKDLPPRRAPATLAPRVRAALRARAAQPWYGRAWWQWPPAARALSLLIFSSLLGGLTWVGLNAGRSDLGTALGTRVADTLASVAPLWALLATLVEAMARVLQCVPLAAWAGALAFFAAMYLATIGLGTALYRIALPQRNP